MFSIDVDATEKVSDMKKKVEIAKSTLIADKQKLIHAGKVLKDEQVLQELGLKESDFIVCMITKDVAKKQEVSAPAPAPAPTPAPTPTPAPIIAPVPVSAPVSTPSSVEPPVVPPVRSAEVVAPPQPAQPFSREALQSLVSMGFPENECKAALSAASGNPDLAYEFLLTGIPEIPRAASTPSRSSDGIERLRQHPQLNSLKRLIQQNPAALPQVLDSIGQQDPALLAAIHENNEAFIALMNEPIVEAEPESAVAAEMPSDFGGSAQILQMIAGLPPNQRAQFAQSIGLSAEQLEGFITMVSSLPPGEAQDLLNGNGNADPPGVVRLTEDEMAAVNRLVALGFTQQQAAQAYLACDKNEALAANLLLEGGWGDDDDGDNGNNDMYY